jgi:hypothetical protein
LRAHDAQLVLHACPDAELVDRRHALEVLGRFVGGIARRHLDAGIVERHVEPAIFGNRPINCGGDLRLVRHVAGHADRNAAFLDDLRRFLRGKIPVAIGQHHGRAVLCEGAGGGEAHAHRRAGDQSHLTREVIGRIHVSVLQRGVVDDEAILHVAALHPVIGRIDLLDRDQLDIGDHALLRAEVEHLLRFGNAAD